MIAAPSRVFIGRSRELSELETALGDARAGRGRLCLITGDAGIGKTRLAEELAERASAGGARVLWGRGWEGGGAPGYWPWIQILRRLLKSDAAKAPCAHGAAASALARLVPELIAPVGPADAPPDSEPARFALFDAIAALLRGAAARRPLVLLLDDLHAADVSSLLLLEFSARELRDTNLLVIGTCRERDADLDAARAAVLTRAARLAHGVPLYGWGEREIAAFVERAFEQSPAPALAGAVHRATEGNPFYVVETLRWLAAESPAALPAELPAALPVPASVRQSIRAHLAVLSAPCHRTLDVAAVIGREFDLALLREATGTSDAQLLADLGRAVAAGAIVARTAARRWVFRHGLVRATLYDDLPAAERARLHQHVGDALERLHGSDSNAHLAETAHHFLHGAAAGSADKAVAYAVRAARHAAAQTAYEEAAARYEDALAVLARGQPGDAGARAALLLALGAVQARIATGAGRAACQRAAAAARAAGDPVLLARAALGFAERGLGVPQHAPDRDAVALLDEALAALPAGDGALRTRLLARLAVELAVSEDRARGDALSTQAVEMARRLGDPVALAHALSARCFVLWRWDVAADRPAIATEIVRLAEALGDAELEIQGRTWLAFDRMRAGDAAELDAQIAHYGPLAERLRHPRDLWMTANLRAMRALWRGDCAAAEAQLERALAIAERVDDDSARFNPLVQRFALRREQGRLAEQEAMARLVAARAPGSPAPRTFLALLLCELGQTDEARHLFDGLAREDFADLRRDRRLGVLPYLAEVCAALGDAPRAELLYALLLPLAETNIPYGASLCFGCGAHYLGLLAATSVSSQKFCVYSGERSAFLARRADAGISGIFRGGATPPGSPRAGGMGTELLRRDTSAQLDLAIEHFERALDLHARMDGPPWLARTQLACARALQARAATGDRARAERLVAEALATARALGLQGLLDTAAHPSPPPAGRTPPAPAAAGAAARRAVFRREGEFWAVGDGRALVRLKDSKGLRYLAHLLRHPGHDFHVTELVALERGSAVADPRGVLQEAGVRVDRGDGAELLLDAKAQAAYRGRLAELRSDLDAVTRADDRAGAAHVQAEMDLLTRELARGVGGRGRSRPAASLAERARLNVGRTIATAVQRIAAHHPSLGRHLAATIQTGAFCSYTSDPHAPLDWEL